MCPGGISVERGIARALRTSIVNLKARIIDMPQTTTSVTEKEKPPFISRNGGRHSVRVFEVLLFCCDRHAVHVLCVGRCADVRHVLFFHRCGMCRRVRMECLRLCRDFRLRSFGRIVKTKHQQQHAIEKTQVIKAFHRCFLTEATIEEHGQENKNVAILKSR